jgi:hypothetical protein
VGDGDAICALDRGWEAAWVAVDSDQRCSEQRKGSKMGVCKCKSECVGSSRMCSRSRRRRGCAGAGAGKPAGGVAARAAAARRGEARAGQREVGKAAGKA